MEAAETKVPSIAAWLGGLGAVPFIGLAGATPFLAAAPRNLVVHALIGYGATILSFLGGAHWGLAISPQNISDRENLPARLIVSVIPSLVGWSALLVAETTGLFILAVGVAALLWVDLRAARLSQVPSWYPKLRIPLTGAVVAALLLVALAR